MKVNNILNNVKIKNVVGDTLPYEIAKVVKKHTENYHQTWDKKTIMDTLKDDRGLGNKFNWSNTPEGTIIWHDVDNGNYQPFYNFHNIKEAK